VIIEPLYVQELGEISTMRILHVFRLYCRYPQSMLIYSAAAALVPFDLSSSTLEQQHGRLGALRLEQQHGLAWRSAHAPPGAPPGVPPGASAQPSCAPAATASAGRPLACRQPAKAFTRCERSRRGASCARSGGEQGSAGAAWRQASARAACPASPDVRPAGRAAASCASAKTCLSPC